MTKVKKSGDDWVHIESGHPVTTGRVEKMSKSKRNTVDPEPILAKYGADAVRWLMLQAAQTRGLDPDRISFTGAIHVLGQGILQSSFYSADLTTRALKRMCADLASPGHLVAPRRLRFNCRVVKHICTRFRRKRPEHHNLTLKHTSFADILLI